MALLALIPIKDWTYGIIIAALLAFGMHYHSLEKQEHEAKAVAISAQNDVKRIDIAAQTTETQSALIYKEIVRIPDVPDVGIVCRNTSHSTLPAANAVAGTSTGNPAPDSAVGPGYDPSGAALTRAKAADAQIAYLQRRVHELETQMNNSP